MTSIDRPSALSGLTVRALADTTPEVAARAFATGFSGYQVPIALTAAQLDARFRGENADSFASYVFESVDEPVAILLIARRGWSSRVGAMGIAPALRGTGLGAEIVRRAISEARSRGDARLVLEVIESNTRAVKLYERAGFEVVRPLWGFSFDADGPGPAAFEPAQEIDPAAGTVRAGRFGASDLPWQLQVPSLAAMVRPTRCFVDAAGSIVAMVDASQETVRLRAVAFDPDLSPAAAADFTASLRAAFADRSLAAPPIYPEGHRARFFAPGGWTTIAMRQFEMRHLLDAG